MLINSVKIYSGFTMCRHWSRCYRVNMSHLFILPLRREKERKHINKQLITITWCQTRDGDKCRKDLQKENIMLPG